MRFLKFRWRVKESRSFRKQTRKLAPRKRVFSTRHLINKDTLIGDVAGSRKKKKRKLKDRGFGPRT